MRGRRRQCRSLHTARRNDTGAASQERLNVRGSDTERAACMHMLGSLGSERAAEQGQRWLGSM